jgi:hypothetical protein
MKQHSSKLFSKKIYQKKFRQVIALGHSSFFAHLCKCSSCLMQWFYYIPKFCNLECIIGGVGKKLASLRIIKSTQTRIIAVLFN